MKSIAVQIINAFIDNGKGGNPAGVVLNADNLTRDEKLKIAAKVGLSETAFVSKSKIAEYKLDFFTPNRQIAHCGHATIATFSYLSQKELIKNKYSSKETIDGVREIVLNDGIAFMEQRAPKYTDVSNRIEIILRSLGIEKKDLIENHPVSVVNTGNSFLIIPVKDEVTLKQIEPDLGLIKQISEEFDLIGYYVFCHQTENGKRDANARMFAPRYGIEEEAGTGMAAGPLACYLNEKCKLLKDTYYIQQGWFMKSPSPSLIKVELTFENGAISKIMAGGKGKIMAETIVEI